MVVERFVCMPLKDPKPSIDRKQTTRHGQLILHHDNVPSHTVAASYATHLTGLGRFRLTLVVIDVSPTLYIKHFNNYGNFEKWYNNNPPLKVHCIVSGGYLQCRKKWVANDGFYFKLTIFYLQKSVFLMKELGIINSQVW